MELVLDPGSICFTYCQVPVIYQLADQENLEISFKDGSESSLDSLELDKENSRKVFERTAEIQLIRINLKEERLR